MNNAGAPRRLLAALCGLAAALALGTAHAQAAYDYQVLWIEGGVGTSPTGIGEDGTIVGSYQLESGPDLLVRPFSYRDGVYTVYPAGKVASLSFDDVNDAGHVVSNLVHRDFTTEAFFGDHDRRTLLAVPGAISTQAYALNDRDLAVGSYLHDPDSHGIATTSAFAWSAGRGYRHFDAPGAATLTIAWGVGPTGTIVGVRDDAQAIYHGFVRTPDGRMRTIDYPGSPYTQLMGINARGDIVGFYQDPADFVLKGFVLRDGTFTRVSPPGADNGSYPYRITDDGRIVGWYLDANFRTLGFLATAAAR